MKKTSAKKTTRGRLAKPLLDVDMGGLNDQIGFALRLAQVAVFSDLTIALRAIDLKPIELSLLRLIGANPEINQSRLSEVLRIQHPNLVALINQLEQRALIERSAVPGNRRANALKLTVAGAKLLAKGEAIDADHLRRIKKAVGASHAPLLLEILQRLANLNSQAGNGSGKSDDA